MHIDLWGKYDVTSLNGHQYFILFVDDASQFITTQFLKRKDKAAQAVMNYLTHLTTHGKPPSVTRRPGNRVRQPGAVSEELTIK